MNINLLCNAAAERDLQPPDRQAGAREGRPGGAEGGPEPGRWLIHPCPSIIHACILCFSEPAVQRSGSFVPLFHA